MSRSVEIFVFAHESVLLGFVDCFQVFLWIRQSILVICVAHEEEPLKFIPIEMQTDFVSFT